MHLASEHVDVTADPLQRRGAVPERADYPVSRFHRQHVALARLDDVQVTAFASDLGEHIVTRIPL